MVLSSLAKANALSFAETVKQHLEKNELGSSTHLGLILNSDEMSNLFKKLKGEKLQSLTDKQFDYFIDDLNSNNTRAILAVLSFASTFTDNQKMRAINILIENDAVSMPVILGFVKKLNSKSMTQVSKLSLSSFKGKSLRKAIRLLAVLKILNPNLKTRIMSNVQVHLTYQDFLTDFSRNESSVKDKINLNDERIGSHLIDVFDLYHLTFIEKVEFVRGLKDSNFLARQIVQQAMATNSIDKDDLSEDLLEWIQLQLNSSCTSTLKAFSKTR